MTDVDLQTLVLMVASGDQSAVPRLRALATELNELADQLAATPESGFTAPSGCTDRVIMRVVSPDGHSRTTDTGA